MNGMILNMYQANLFIQSGAKVTGCGISKGKAFIQFEVNQLFLELMDKWNRK